MRWAEARQFAIVATFVLSAAAPAGAVDYPSRPIKMVVPISAGAGMDVSARIVAKAMSEQMGQNIIVENKPGASGNLGTTLVVRAPADGYTILLTTANLGLAPITTKDLGWDPVKDLAPIAMLGDTPLLLAVNHNLPVTTLRDLVELARKRPGELNYGTPGTATIHHFAMELLRERTGINVVQVAYAGVAAALTDLAGGRVEMEFSSQANLQPFIDGGQVRALATTSQTRLPSLPDVPTMREAGFADAAVTVWIGLFAPANTPANALAVLSREAQSAMQKREVIDGLERIGVVAAPGTAEKLGAGLQREVSQWQRVAIAINNR